MKRLLAVLVFCLFACNAYAENLKIGVVNLDQVIQKSALSMTLNAKLSNDFKPRQETLNTAVSKLQNDSDQLTYGAYKMSQEERAKLQQTIVDDKRQVEALSKSLQADIASAQAEYNQQLMTKLNSVITKIAENGKYDVIQTNANLLFLNSSINITQQVIDQMK
jgi:outer membrane protein